MQWRPPYLEKIHLHSPHTTKICIDLDIFRLHILDNLLRLVDLHTFLGYKIYTMKNQIHPSISLLDKAYT